jgi:DnaJ-class molecular chaperone
MLRIDSGSPSECQGYPLVPRKNGVSIKWPGDDLKVDFLARYDDQAGTKPERGENLTATATVPPELGGSVRVALPTGRVFDVTIPAGFEEGTQIRLRGQGKPGPIGGKPGDALITIKIAP